MIDQQQQIDHDEHRAVIAERDAERAGELRHEQVRADLVDALLTLAEQQQQQARRLVTEGTLPTINARGTLGPSHLLYLGRAVEVAHLATRTARTVERHGGYAIGAQVEAMLLAHEQGAMRRTAPGHEAAVEVATWAARQVRDTARRVLAGTPEATGLPGATR